MTCHVFPKVKPISVIPLVSININPAPRKKNEMWLNLGLSETKFAAGLAGPDAKRTR
jgi:hypothetical protein